MAVASLISVEEYLTTSYRPDRDYVDGEVLERNLGEFDHNRAQRNILFYLMSQYPHLFDRVIQEQRVQVTPTRFRIPDLCVRREDAPEEQVFRAAPELCVEILSPEDRMSRIMDRVEDYFHMGVPHCWIVDPQNCRAWTARPGHLDKVTDGILRAGAIEIPLAEIFKSQERR